MKSVYRLRSVIKKIIKEQFEHPYLADGDLLQIMKGYITCALWTEEEQLRSEANPDAHVINFDNSDVEHKGEESDIDKLVRMTNNLNKKQFINFSKEDIDSNSLIQAYLDIKKFIELANNSILTAIQENGLEQLGHDLWLTRNHHGAGFFDRNYDDEVEKNLIQSAHALKEVDLYLGDDMKLYFSNSN